MKTRRFTLLVAFSLLTGSTFSQLALDLSVFSNGYTDPVDIQNAGDSRLFIVEKPGLIQICDDQGVTNAQPFLDIQSRVKDAGGEQGLLGLAFHPNYTSNGFFYVNYTKQGDSTVIARYSVTSNPDSADPNSEQILMTLYQPYTNHNGGGVVFGPDGYLYIGLGDGGSGGDPGNRAQDSLEILGKMLRIDVDSGTPYGIPADNPFVGNAGALDEIWALGLRNPWRYSFDPSTGDLWIADVGQNAYEEINLQPASSTGGENYGWRCYEGNAAYNTSGCVSSSLLTFPIHDYSHSLAGFSCSVTGGYVYRGTNSAMAGRYFYADVCSGQIRTLEENSPGVYTDELVYEDGSEQFVTFGLDINGEQYVAGLSSGIIYHLEEGVGIEESTLSEIRLYPNPAEEVITVELDDLRIDRIEILDINGRIVQNAFGPFSGNEQIDVSELDRGSYMFRFISVDGGTSHSKVVIH